MRVRSTWNGSAGARARRVQGWLLCLSSSPAIGPCSCRRGAAEASAHGPRQLAPDVWGAPVPGRRSGSREFWRVASYRASARCETRSWRLPYRLVAARSWPGRCSGSGASRTHAHLGITCPRSRRARRSASSTRDHASASAPRSAPRAPGADESRWTDALPLPACTAPARRRRRSRCG